MTGTPLARTLGAWTIAAGVLLVAGCTSTGSLSGFACAAEPAPVSSLDVAREPALLQSFYALPAPNHNRERRDELAGRLRAAGCTGDRLQVGDTRWLRASNVVCDLPGSSPATILIGAHYDKTQQGQGAVDNWSGINLLAYLYRDLASKPRHYSYRLVGFGGEEELMRGSTSYLEGLDREDTARIHAMINLDTLGIRAPRADPRSTPELACTLVAASRIMNLPLERTLLGPPLLGDWKPFLDAGIPVLNLHALTQGDLGMLHSPRDRASWLDAQKYQETYRLVSGFLQLLDRGGASAPLN